MCKGDIAAPDVALYKLLDACHETNTKPPAETKHITCTSALALHLANLLAVGNTTLDVRAVFGAYGGMPVKQVWHQVNHTAIRIEGLMERDMYLRRKAAKRKEAA